MLVKERKERPTLTAFRLFSLQKKLIEKEFKIRKGKVSKAQIVREAIEAYIK